MEKELNLAELTKNISDKLLVSKELLGIMEYIIEGDSKLEFLHKQILNNITASFYEVEECRRKIYILDE